MKKRRYAALGIFMAGISAAVFAQDQYFDLGRFSFFLTPKILKDGSITDFGLGYEYTERSAGALRLRFSNQAKNEQFAEAIPDSLNAVDENSFEVFLTPFEYFFVKKRNTKIQAGLGLYYDFNTLAEKGYFTMPVLETLGKEKVNAFSNDFTMHMLGPSLEAGVSYRLEWFAISVHGGMVPFFYLNTRQNMSIVPLMEPDRIEYSQSTSGSPYIYADTGFILFKYISLVLLYDFSRLDYQVIDFDGHLNWHHPGRAVITQSFKVEISLLIPLRGSVYTQIGYGYALDFMRLDSDSPVRSNRHYLIFSTKTVK